MLKIDPPVTYALLAKAKKLQDQGNAILDTAFGRNDLTQCLPKTLIKSLQIAHSNKNTSSPIEQYYDPQGLLQLRTEIANQENDQTYKKSNQKITAENICIPPTSKGGIDYATSVLKAAVVVDDCAYPSYAPIAQINKCPVFRYPSQDLVKLDKAIERAVKKRDYVIIIITNPNNPNGRLYSKEDLIQRAAIMSAHHKDEKTIICLADEIYDKIIFPGNQFISMAELYPHTLRVGGFSKNEALAGLRLGKLIVPPSLKHLIPAFKAIATHRHGSVNCAAQTALVEVFNKEPKKELGGKSTASKMQEFYQKESLIYAIISKESLKILKEVFDVAQTPAGSFYAAITVKPKYRVKFRKNGIKTSIVLAEYILSQTISQHNIGVPLIPISGFGGKATDFTFRIVLKYCDNYKQAFNSLDESVVKKAHQNGKDWHEHIPANWYNDHCKVLARGLKALVAVIKEYQ